MESDEHISWLKPIVSVKRNELFLCASAILLFFLVIGNSYIIKPIRESLLVSQFSPEQYPKFYIVVCLITLPVGVALAYLIKRLSPRIAIPVIYVGCAAIFLFFWIVLFTYREKLQDAQLIGSIFYFWSAVYNVLTVCIFWSLSNALFNQEQAKRLYGLVGIGGIVGGMLGSTLTAYLAEIVTTIGLLPIAACGLLACAGLSVSMYKKAYGKISDEAAGQETVVDIRTLPAVFRSPYVAMIGIMVVLYTTCITSVDLQIKGIVRSEGLPRDTITRFWGGYYAYVNGLALITQIIITSRVLRRWGPKVGLLFLPLTFLALSPLLLLVPPAYQVSLPIFGQFPLRIFLLAVVGVPIGAFAYSIQQSSKELLYVPANAAIKYQAKGIIDIFGFRLGNSVMSLIALIGAGGAVARSFNFAIVAYALGLFWLFFFFF
ncbi:MAG TPA: Npt1/Npt2 family nucleotide transporter, partial [Blastocatellia bacterium]|nr:Npt1/Npt2 family nucleotide transporter [Blastocatellia bacterium]